MFDVMTLCTLVGEQFVVHTVVTTEFTEALVMQLTGMLPLLSVLKMLTRQSFPVLLLSTMMFIAWGCVVGALGPRVLVVFVFSSSIETNERAPCNTL